MKLISDTLLMKRSGRCASFVTRASSVFVSCSSLSTHSTMIFTHHSGHTTKLIKIIPANNGQQDQPSFPRVMSFSDCKIRQATPNKTDDEKEFIISIFSLFKPHLIDKLM